MIKRWKGIGMMAIAFILISAMVIPSSTAKAEERVVKIGLYSVFTGPAAMTVVPATYGAQDYIKWMNEQGGIHGIKGELIWEETGAMTAKAVPAYRRMAARGARIMISPIDTFVEATLDSSIKEEILQIYAADGFTYVMAEKMAEVAGGEPWVVGSSVGSGEILVNVVRFILENWTEERPLRLGSISSDMPIIRGAWEMGAPYIVEKFGVEYVGSEFVPFIGIVDTTVELMRLREKKPDWIAVDTYGGGVTTVIKDIGRLGLMEEGIKFVADAAAADDPSVRAAGKAGHGLYKQFYFYCTTEDVPGIKLPLEMAKKYHGQSPKEVSSFYFLGWELAQMSYEGIRIAIEKVGFENLTGRAIRDGVFSIKNLEVGVQPPVTISEDKPFFVDYTKFYQWSVDKDMWEPRSEWIPIPSIWDVWKVDSPYWKR